MCRGGTPRRTLNANPRRKFPEMWAPRLGALLMGSGTAGSAPHRPSLVPVDRGHARPGLSSQPPTKVFGCATVDKRRLFLGRIQSPTRASETVRAACSELGKRGTGKTQQ